MGNGGIRKIAVVTVARSDYGIYLPILALAQAEPKLDLNLIVGGTHLASKFGKTVTEIEKDGFPIFERIEVEYAHDTPNAVAVSSGQSLVGYANALARLHPDILLVLGDRIEMHAAAVAALPFKIAVAHIHGGEVTEGAIDDALRHSITKLSHLHFVATEEYARRVRQLGEESWRVHVVGAPSLDNLTTLELLDSRTLQQKLGLTWDQPPLLVTFHPVTLEYEQAAWQMTELLGAIQEISLPVLFTMPNADTHNSVIRKMIFAFAATQASAHVVENLGTQAYMSMMALAPAMVGNSSSGVIEAASFRLPVVNVGTRQDGRVRATNVIDTGYQKQAIAQALRRALSSEFREHCAKVVNPYGDGHAAERIIERIKQVSIDERLLRKRFIDL